MEYYFSKTINCSFDNAVQKVTEALKTEGFGILTEIDIKATLKKKLAVDFYNYKILGAESNKRNENIFVAQITLCTGAGF